MIEEKAYPLYFKTFHACIWALETIAVVTELKKFDSNQQARKNWNVLDYNCEKPHIFIDI